MDVRFCGQCGNGLQTPDRFCSSCGAPVLRAERDGLTAPRPLRTAAAHLAKQEPAQALALLEALCGEEPANAVAHAYRGIALLRVVRIGDAREALEQAVALAPDSFICRSKWAEFLAQLGFYDQAVAQLDVAIALPPPDAMSLHAALELRHFSREKAKGIYYRPLIYPKLGGFRLRRRAVRPVLTAQGGI